MRRLLLGVRPCNWLLTLVVVLPLGCGKSEPQPASPEKARQALRTALDAWKNGQAPGALKQGTPPIFVNDRAWEAGRRLANYEIQDNSEFHGTQFRCWVRLSLLDGQGKPAEETVKYLIDTQPALVIVRDDL